MRCVLRFITIALLLLLVPTASRACGGSNGNHLTLQYDTATFSGEAHAGELTESKLQSTDARQIVVKARNSLVFRMEPKLSGGWIMNLDRNGINLIDQKERDIDTYTVNAKDQGKVLPFSFYTLSVDGANAAGIVLSLIKSPEEKKAATVKLTSMYTGQGKLRILDVKMQSGVTGGSDQHSSIDYLKFEGEIKYPIQVFHLCN